MSGSLLAIFVSIGAITLAEMGDKTQLLAMAFAVRFKAWKVILGIFLATVLNHALAVAVGSLLMRIRLLDLIIQTAAAAAFILFGLWTLHGDKLEGEQEKPSRFGPLMTVAIAFFIAEMGDKTQLTTLALAAKYPDVPALVLLGTTTGMLIADGFGIIFGVLMCRRIPERKVKLVSAAVFILFGFISGYEVCAVDYALSSLVTILILAALAVIVAVITRWLLTHEDKATGYAGVAELNACPPEEQEKA
ncbi:MAG: TMEM165/GDT1 family protein [Treponemataceae bacterium]